MAAAPAAPLRSRASGSHLAPGARRARFLLKACGEDEARALPPKQLVARALGMRPETLSRCLRRFIDRGLVTEEPTRRVRNREGLSAIAAGSEG